MKNNENILRNIVIVSGSSSNGVELAKITSEIEKSPLYSAATDKVSVVNYSPAHALIGWMPGIKSILGDYIASRLAVLSYAYPNAETTVIAHGFCTLAVANAIQNRNQYFRINKLILVGSVISTKFNWSQHAMLVHNFICRKDKIIWLTLLCGGGLSGKMGFEDHSNVTQILKSWDHQGYANGSADYLDIIYKGTNANVAE